MIKDSRLIECVRNSASRQELWSNFINAYELKKVIEIGVYRGDFAAHLLSTSEIIELYYMLDPWKRLDNWNKPANKDDKTFESFYNETLQKTEFAAAKRKILRGKTTEVLDQVDDRSLDFAYIDGDHTLRGITIDLVSILPKIRNGGWLAGDDFCSNIWQHSFEYEPTLIFPMAVYFAEAISARIFALPYNQFLIEKNDEGVFEFIDLTGRYKDTTLRNQFVQTHQELLRKATHTHTVSKPVTGPKMTRQFISFPKSGRTWIRYVLTQLGLEKEITFHHDNFEFNDGTLPPHNFDITIRKENYKKIDKIVYLRRDPRDVIVSLYHQVTGRFKSFFNYNGSISAFIRHEYFGAEILHKFRTMWDEISTLPNIMVVDYEQCHENMVQVIKNILEFYDFDVSEERISKAVENSSLEKMRAVEQNNSFSQPWLRPKNNSFKVRKGKKGGYKEELSDDDIAYLNSVFGLDRDTSDTPEAAPKNILIAWFTFSLNGGIGRFIHVARVLEKQGHSVKFVSLDNTKETEWPYLQGKIMSVAEALEEQWDAVMIPGAGVSDEQLPGFEVLNNPRFGLRIQHILNDRSREERFIKVNSVLKPHIIIVNNSHWDSFVNLDANIFHILAGGVDTNVHGPVENKQIPISKNSWQIGGYGRKNPEPLMAAIRDLPEKYKLHLYGISDYPCENAQILKEQGRLTFWGNVYDEELADFYNKMDVVVTTELFAGWCNTAAQAMAHGIPVICSRAGTIDFAEDKQNSLLMESVNPEEIKSKLKELTGNRELMKRLSENAAEKMKQFSWEKYSNDLLELIRKPEWKHYYRKPSLGLYGKRHFNDRIAGLDFLLDKIKDHSVLDVGAVEGLVGLYLARHAGVRTIDAFEYDSSKVEANGFQCVSKIDQEIDNEDGTLCIYERIREREQSEQEFVLILGMHRSGTSMLANIINSAGYYVGEPDDLMAPSRANEKGYFERKSIFKANDVILNLCNGTWYDPPQKEALTQVRIDPFLRPLLDVYKDKSRVVLKDPRFCLTFPVWRHLLPANLKIVYITRENDAVIRSLVKRESFDPQKMADLCTYYNDSVQDFIQDYPHIQVRYEDLFSSKKNDVLSMLSTFISTEKDLQSIADEIIDERLNHNQINKMPETGQNTNKAGTKTVIVTEAFPALTETFILNQITGLIDRGLDVEIWAAVDLKEKQVHRDVDRYKLTAKTRYIVYPKNVKDEKDWLKQFENLNHIDYLNDISSFHVHFGPSFNRLWPLFHAYPGKYVLVSFHGYDASKYFREHGDNCYEYLFKRANHITTPSNYMKSKLTSRGADPNKVIVHHYGKDLSVFKPVKKRKDGRKVRFLSIARLVPKKGLEYAIRAFAALNDKADTEYVIIGEGPLLPEFKKLIHDLGMQERIRIEPFRDSDEIIEALGETDVYVLTSVTAGDGDQEGIPVSLIEAHAMGIPIISSIHAGIPELVAHKKSGLLSDERNVDQISKHMEMLISDKKRRNAFSREARKIAEDEFDLEKLNNNLAALLNASTGQYMHKKQQEEVSREPLVSVLVPTYNRADYIRETLESALSQDYSNLEVVVCDDGSTDQTADVLKTVQDERVRYILKEHTNAPDTRNRAIREANGEFLFWLDSDDVMEPGILKKYVRLAAEYPDAGIYYADLYIADENLNVQKELRYEDWYNRNPELISKLITGNYIPNGGSFVRKEIYKNFGFFDKTFNRAHDYEFYSRAAASVIFKKLNAFSIKWRWHDTNMSSESVQYDKSYDVKITMNMMSRYSLDRLFPQLPWNDNEDNRCEAIAYLNIAHRLKFLGDTETSYSVLLKSLREFPGKEAVELLNELECASGKELNSLTFSVVIPTRNRPEKLEKAIESALQQNVNDFEVIVVNDGGDDVTHIIESFKEQDKIIYINQASNKGPAAARNAGIQAALGKYIALLDDDDEFYENHLETALTHLSETIPVVYTDATRATYHNDGNTYKLVDKRVPYSIDYDRNRLLIGNISPINCFVFSRELALKAGLFDESMQTLEDWDFWIRLSRFTAFKHIPEPTVQVNWRTDGTTLTTSRQQDFQVNRERIYKKNSADIRKIPNIQQILDEFKAIWQEDGKPAGTQEGLKTNDNRPSQSAGKDVTTKKQPLVSIIMLTRNALKFTRECIASIQKHTRYPYEIVFVDNGSRDGTKKYLRELVKKNDNFSLVSNKKNLGFAAGNNQGVEKANGRYVLLLNNDVHVSGYWLSSMVNALELDDHIGMVGPLTNSISGRQLVADVPYKDLEGFHEYAKQVRKINAGTITPRRRLAGFALLMRKDVYQKVGGLDVTFGLGNFEDDDLSLRVREAGYALMVDESTFIHHYGSQSFVANKIDYKKSLDDREKLFEKKWPGVDYEELLELKNPLVQAIEEKLHRAEQLFLNGQMAEAGALYRQILQDNPIEGAALLGAAYTSKNLGNADESVRYLSRLLKIFPDNAIAYNELGTVFVQTGDREKAADLFIKAIELDPACVDAQRNYADLLILQGDFQNGVNALVKILENHPDDIPTLLYLAQLYIEAGRHEQALPFLSKVNELDPENEAAGTLISSMALQPEDIPAPVEEDETDVLFEQAIQAKNEGDTARSISLLNQLIKRNPDYAPAYNLLGLVSWEMKDGEGARAFLVNAIEKDPSLVEAQRNYGDILIQLEKYEDGVRVFDTILKNHPDDIPSLLYMGQLYLDAERYMETAAYTARVLELDPSNEIAQKLQELVGQYLNQQSMESQYDPEELTGQAHKKLEENDPREAISLYRKVLEIDPENAGAMYGMGLAYLVIKNNMEAKKWFEYLTLQVPDFAEAYFNLGLIAMHEQDSNKAIQLLTKSSETDPGHKNAKSTLAEVLLNEDRFEEALLLLQDVLRQDPDDIFALTRMGQLNLEVQRNEEARNYFSKVLELDPGNELANTVKQELSL